MGGKYPGGEGYPRGEMTGGEMAGGIAQGGGGNVRGGGGEMP